MKLVKEWINDFLERLRMLFGPPDWPLPGSEEFKLWAKAWIQVMALKQVTEAEADAAAARLMESPPNFRREWPAAVLAQVAAIRAESGSGRSEHATRAAAEDASKGCPHCGGMGLAAVWQPAGDPMTADPSQSPTSAAHCVCPHGRWLRRRVAEQDASLLKRFPDGLDVQAGRSPWRLCSEDNAAWDAAAEAKWAGTPEDERAEWRRLVRDRFPELAGLPRFVESNAIGWCYDPSLVVPRRAAAPPTPTLRAARRVLTGLEPAAPRSQGEPELEPVPVPVPEPERTVS